MSGLQSIGKVRLSLLDIGNNVYWITGGGMDSLNYRSSRVHSLFDYTRKRVIFVEKGSSLFIKLIVRKAGAPSLKEN